MAHSNRHHVQLGLVIAEILVFAGALVTAYFAEIGSWTVFSWIATLALVLYSAIRLVDAMPRIREFLVSEDLAGKVAQSALPSGVSDYFGMQNPKEQTRRNEVTQKAIENATTMWLCANSGASYLDPGIYRHWPFVEKRLDEGVEFRVVLLDPLSEEKKFRNLLNTAGEHHDSKLNVPNLINLYNSYPTLDIKFVRFGMHSTVFCTNDCLFFDPYHVGRINGRIENRTFCVQVTRTTPTEGVGLYRLFKAHFDSLWNEGVGLEQWATNSAANSYPGLPALKPRQALSS